MDFITFELNTTLYLSLYYMPFTKKGFATPFFESTSSLYRPVAIFFIYCFSQTFYQLLLKVNKTFFKQSVHNIIPFYQFKVNITHSELRFQQSTTICLGHKASSIYLHFNSLCKAIITNDLLLYCLIF